MWQSKILYHGNLFPPKSMLITTTTLYYLLIIYFDGEVIKISKYIPHSNIYLSIKV